MHLLSIGTAGPIAEIERRLEPELAYLRREGIDVALRRSPRGNVNFLHVRVSGAKSPLPTEEMQVLVRRYVANALIDVMLTDWQDRWLVRLLHRHYPAFEGEERTRIIRLASERLETEDMAGMERLARKMNALRELTAYLEQQATVNLDGFLTFRLKEHAQRLLEAVERSVDDFLLEREEREYVRLLKGIVEVQTARLDTVHVFFDDVARFRLTDGDGRPVEANGLEDLDLDSGEVSPEDLLLSALIHVSPRSVVLHRRAGPANDALATAVGPAAAPSFGSSAGSLAVLREVFAGRIRSCQGCPRCAAPTVGPPPAVTAPLRVT